MFFTKDPHNIPQKVTDQLRGTTYAMPSTGEQHAPTTASIFTSATGMAALDPTLGSHVQNQAVPPRVLAKGQEKGGLDQLGRDLEAKAVTPINIDRLEKELVDYPDQSFARNLCLQLRTGAKIGYNGPRIFRFSKNLPTALKNPEKITENLEKELQLGRVAGPFSSPPFPNFQVSPLGIIPKKHSDNFRTIFHLSFPKSGDSINSFIDKEDYSLSYVTIDDAIETLNEFGIGSFMAKTDIESAFRLFPVHPGDWELLGMYWQGYYYYDKVLPFGLRSAPFLFNQLSVAVEWILSKKCAISYVTHFLDDFLIIEPPCTVGPKSTTCENSLKSMLLSFQALSIPLSPCKTQGPSTCLEFLGIVLDSLAMEARLPSDKIQRIMDELTQWRGRKSATLVELQSLIGTLNFACRVVPPGRAFLQRIINLTVGLKKAHHRTRLSKAFFDDLAMWEIFVRGWNGKSFFLNKAWETSFNLHLFTDASGSLGYGGIYGSQWFQGTWLAHQTLSSPGVSIAWQELYAIVVACAIWGPRWTRKRILFHCDNSAVVSIINTKRSKSERVMSLVRKLTLLTLRCNFYFKAVHVPGAMNEVADSLSRFQGDRFRRLAPGADQQPRSVPTELSDL